MTGCAFTLPYDCGGMIQNHVFFTPLMYPPWYREIWHVIRHIAMSILQYDVFYARCIVIRCWMLLRLPFKLRCSCFLCQHEHDNLFQHIEASDYLWSSIFLIDTGDELELAVAGNAGRRTDCSSEVTEWRRPQRCYQPHVASHRGGQPCQNHEQEVYGQGTAAALWAYLGHRFDLVRGNECWRKGALLPRSCRSDPYTAEVNKSIIPINYISYPAFKMITIDWVRYCIESSGFSLDINLIIAGVWVHPALFASSAACHSCN